MGRLDGKVALISGSARGIGAATARLFAQEGAAVVISDILDDLGAEVAKDITSRGGRAAFAHLDVADEQHWVDAVALAESRFGKLDVLFNNASVNNGPLAIVDVTRAEWDRVIAVNLTGMFLGAKAAIPAMRRAGGGSIVNCSSVSGLVASDSVAYGATKGGIRQLTKAIAKRHAKENIRCNTVCPGSTNTAAIRVHNRTPEELAKRVAPVLLGRMAEPDEIAQAVLFLASDESSFMTGSDLVVDGGTTAV